MNDSSKSFKDTMKKKFNSKCLATMSTFKSDNYKTVVLEYTIYEHNIGYCIAHSIAHILSLYAMLLSFLFYGGYSCFRMWCRFTGH